ncbi:DUF1343 domain-containing protein [Rariglobus hedericola]|uniref:DUF1343 domain-containing protein n=2 Tax=Rariglobus hedericola TaxID=2597822 RepID=A0A556QSZ0_9BACT|nr:DUF1343 domain-containing protein [Rariglobus hedericola]
MLGIDVLEATGFRAIAGKKVGLLTHPAGVNRRGESTIDVLRRAPNARLVALFAPEHSLSGDVKASVNFEDVIDPRTKLPVYSLHGKNRKPTPSQLKGLDALVIDLQDIGVRSYTYNVVMRYAIEACFENGVEVIVLDRPNPLGGFKVDGPILDREWFSGVGAYQMPYVHGLTMAEIARLAASEPGILAVPESVRRKGRITLVPMRGWKRSMRWPDTGLKFIPTSPLVRDFPAVMGYAMIGLGCEYSGFKHGVGTSFPFRGLTFKGVTADRLIRDLKALNIAGLSYRKITVPDAAGKPKEGVYVDVSDWQAWRPTELSFELMRLACRYDPPNPFLKVTSVQARSFNIHVGSTAWWTALKRDGANVNVEANIAAWRNQALSYQQLTRKYWLYN